MSVGCEEGRRKSSSHGRLAERLTSERSEEQLRGARLGGSTPRVPSGAGLGASARWSVWSESHMGEL